MPSPQQRTPGEPDAPSAPHHRAAAAIRARRLELGWTQEHLAERSGVSVATVRKLEAAAQPRYRDLTCTRVCAALGWAAGALDELRADPSARATIPTAPPSPLPDRSVPQPGPRNAALAALNGRLAQLDDRQWERLVAFVDGLTATDHDDSRSHQG